MRLAQFTNVTVTSATGLVRISVARRCEPSSAPILVGTITTDKNTAGIGSSLRRLTLTETSPVSEWPSSDTNEPSKRALLVHMTSKTTILPSSQIRNATVVKGGRNTRSSKALILTRVLGVEEVEAILPEPNASLCSSGSRESPTILTRSLSSNATSLTLLERVRPIPSQTSDGDEGTWSGWNLMIT